MTDLAGYHGDLGGRLAPDGIPLDYGNGRAEFEASLGSAVLCDRSHDGRSLLRGRDRFELVNRMSTNELSQLQPDEGAATIFTNANARILYRAACFNRPEGLLLISEAGQGSALADHLRRNIFFGDQVAVDVVSERTAQFALHGPQAAAVIAAIQADLAADLSSRAPFNSEAITAAGCPLTVARRKDICGTHWALITPVESAVTLHRHLLRAGAAIGLRPAGSLTYNSLRIRAGRPAGLELSPDYLPLEVGLWDEVSFTKGCYTGQEIIARMESRRRLAKTIVKVAPAAYVPAPAAVTVDGKQVGLMTSCVAAADGEVYALAVLRTDSAKADVQIQIGPQAVPAVILDYAGAQPPFISQRLAASP